jgi:hypothetical protein
MHANLKRRLRMRSVVTIVARDASTVAREGLLRAAINAGLESSTVVDVAEALTGRQWACLGVGEIRSVASELLTAANRVAHRPGRGVHPCVN